MVGCSVLPGLIDIFPLNMWLYFPHKEIQRHLHIEKQTKTTPFAGFNKDLIKEAKKQETKRRAVTAPWKADIH